MYAKNDIRAYQFDATDELIDTCSMYPHSEEAFTIAYVLAERIGPNEYSERVFHSQIGRLPIDYPVAPSTAAAAMKGAA
jgi:hypothetical protein